jgi:predicted negative regulator of RcsB-dependent stress response
MNLHTISRHGFNYKKYLRKGETMKKKSSLASKDLMEKIFIEFAKHITIQAANKYAECNDIDDAVGILQQIIGEKL